MNRDLLITKHPERAIYPQVAVAHLGSRWNYDMPVILEKMGVLTHFYTDAYCGQGSWLAPLRGLPQVLTTSALRRLQARSRQELPPGKVTAFNRLGIEFNLRYSRVKDTADRLQLFLEINQRFNQLMIDHGLPTEANILFSMNTASLELFESLQGTSIKRIMDQNIVPMQVESAVLAEEYDRWAGWSIDDYQDWYDSPIFHQWIEREKREWELADRILCASPRTAAALQSCGVPKTKCEVIPYPVNCQQYTIDRRSRGSSPLRILFAGQANLRKGIPYFLQMLQRLHRDSFEARVVGAIQLNPEILARYSDLCSFTGTVPRNQMMNHYAWADVFVFPSLCDSAPGVTNEALAAGLPVITTEGAGTIVENGVNGWILVDRDVDALVDCVERLNRDRNLLAQMSHNAASQASNIDLVAYGNQFRQACESLLLPNFQEHCVR
jgi:hypothetical protein